MDIQWVVMHVLSDLFSWTRCGMKTSGFDMSARLSKKPSRVYPRLTRFGAIIPGNSVAEQVLTNGLSNFL